MADWSQLPDDLLLQIGDSLRSPVDVLRFRSVCSTWRSTLQPKPRCLPDHFQIIVDDDIPSFRLFKRTIYRFAIPPDLKSGEDASDWIVKVTEDASDGMQMMNPLSGELSAFTGILDLLKIRVSELGQEYLMHFLDELSDSSYEVSTVYDEMVAFRQHVDSTGFELLTTRLGSLGMFKHGDQNWTTIKDTDSPFVDVKLFNGEFYAVDSNGRMVIVESCGSIELLADSVCRGDVKFLVESSGCLLLVDIWLNVELDFDAFLDNEGDDDGAKQRFWKMVNKDSVRIKVYKLVEKEKKWEEMDSLGDQILFLGNNCTFSASAADVSGYEGNCIYTLSHRNEGDDRTGKAQATDIAVYHLHSSKFERLHAESKHGKLFWPPPTWVSNTICGREAVVQEQV